MTSAGGRNAFITKSDGALQYAGLSTWYRFVRRRTVGDEEKGKRMVRNIARGRMFSARFGVARAWSSDFSSAKKHALQSLSRPHVEYRYRGDMGGSHLCARVMHRKRLLKAGHIRADLFAEFSRAPLVFFTLYRRNAVDRP